MKWCRKLVNWLGRDKVEILCLEYTQMLKEWVWNAINEWVLNIHPSNAQTVFDWVKTIFLLWFMHISTCSSSLSSFHHLIATIELVWRRILQSRILWAMFRLFLARFHWPALLLFLVLLMNSWTQNQNSREHVS